MPNNSEPQPAAHRRVLVFCADAIPVAGLPTTGAGLRSWGIGKGLEARGHEVLFSVPAVYQQRFNLPPDMARLCWRPDNIVEHVNQVRPDVVVFCHWPTTCLPHRLDVPTVIDFHGPHLLERLYQGFLTPEANIREKLVALRKVDFFTCAGEMQRLYFLAWIMLAGFDPRDELLAAIPFSMDGTSMPIHDSSASVPEFVYGGIFLPWQDSAIALTTAAKTLEENDKGILKVFGGPHPALPIEGTEGVRRLMSDLAGSTHVRQPGLIGRDELVKVYTRATAAIDLMMPNVERELAFTSRTVEYLWCGLPVIYNDYAELAGYIRDYDAGWTLRADDVPGIKRVIEEILADPAMAQRKGLNAQRLVREKLSWERTIEPLDRYIRNPVRHIPAPSHEVFANLPRFAGASAEAAHTAAPSGHKSFERLVWEARFHLRTGGIKSVLRHGSEFARRQLSRKN